MNNIVKEFLLIESLQVKGLMEEYHLFFLAVIPSVFLLSVIIDHLVSLDGIALIKRAFVSILILVSVSSFYYSSINLSMNTANEILKRQQYDNVLLKDMFDGGNHWKNARFDDKNKRFFQGKLFFVGLLIFYKNNLFENFINDRFMITVFFISKICFFLLKIVYSLVYYLGYGLIGIPCLLYIFPKMNGVMRGGVISYLWLLIVPHVFVFVVSLLGSEINEGYITGEVIGRSMSGTALLFVMALLIAFIPLISFMILSSSGVAAAGGLIATIGANYVMSLPKKALKGVTSLMLPNMKGILTKALLSPSKGKSAFSMGVGAGVAGGSSGSSWNLKDDKAKGTTNKGQATAPNKESNPPIKTMGIEGGDGAASSNKKQESPLDKYMPQNKPIRNNANQNKPIKNPNYPQKPNRVRRKKK